MNTSNLRRALWGASQAPPSTLELLVGTFPTVGIVNAFGQTEMSSNTCFLKAEDAVRKMGSVGLPAVNVEVRIVDDAGADVPRGEVGEIVYRGPTVMKGYYKNPEATADAFRGGWFHSGDLVRQDDEGFIYVVDRVKDMIISGGENIYPAEVERAVERHPSVREVAVIGVPHPRWVESPVAVVVADGNEHPEQEEVLDFLKADLASYKKPRAVVYVDELPRNASGKILKRELRDSYWDLFAQLRGDRVSRLTVPTRTDQRGVRHYDVSLPVDLVDMLRSTVRERGAHPAFVTDGGPDLDRRREPRSRPGPPARWRRGATRGPGRACWPATGCRSPRRSSRPGPRARSQFR